MAEPLKNHFGRDVPERIAEALAAVHPTLDRDAFVRTCLVGFDDLELTERAKAIADVMADHLPADREQALDLVVASLGPELPNCDPDDVPREAAHDGADHNPIAGFFHLPHSRFVADHGAAHFEASMRANYEITKRFTAEFSVRTQLAERPTESIARLHEWVTDDNVHVRRLVSEGSRPRLPWASRLNDFVDDPEPVIGLLERLKDDPVEYVRRSVANNLNDIAKDHPERVVEIAAAWWPDGDRNRRRLIRHGLRTLIKQAHPGALAVLGYDASSPVEIAGHSIEPASVAIGGRVRIELEVANPADETAGALVDLRVHFVKANGSTSPKVFKGAEVELEPGASKTIGKTISVRQQSTRTHYPGTHQVEAIVNGVTRPLGAFELTDG